MSAICLALGINLSAESLTSSEWAILHQPGERSTHFCSLADLKYSSLAVGSVLRRGKGKSAVASRRGTQLG